MVRENLEFSEKELLDPSRATFKGNRPHGKGTEFFYRELRVLWRAFVPHRAETKYRFITAIPRPKRIPAGSTHVITKKGPALHGGRLVGIGQVEHGRSKIDRFQDLNVRGARPELRGSGN